jgi:hypothetical protein
MNRNRGHEFTSTYGPARIGVTARPDIAAQRRTPRVARTVPAEGAGKPDAGAPGTAATTCPDAMTARIQDPARTRFHCLGEYVFISA